MDSVRRSQHYLFLYRSVRHVASKDAQYEQRFHDWRDGGNDPDDGDADPDDMAVCDVNHYVL